MSNVTTNNFGLLIAYLLPGFIVLWSLSGESETLRTWLGASTTDSPTVGGFLYVTLASIGAGLVVSTLRWLIVDTLHHATGIPRPRWNFGRLGPNLHAFDLLNEQHYRYYQSHSNGLVAVAIWWIVHGRSDGAGWGSVAAIVLMAVLFIGSRDNLRRYYERVDSLLSDRQS